MPDINELVTDYIAAWNEADPGRRRELVGRAFAQDARYLDPLMQGAGTDGIDGMIAEVQQQYAGFRFELADGPDAHNDRVRFSWHLVAPDGGGVVATGYDFARLASDGRLQDVTGFLEMAAQQ